MSGAIIAFPTMQERDDKKFLREGTSAYIQAIDDAEALLGVLAHNDRPADIAARLASLTRQIGSISTSRPEVAGDMIALGGVLVELRIAPSLLAAMAEIRSK